MLNQSTTANEVRTILRKAIRSGVYQAGESLPSSRDLAQQFGINRNTANKIYRELADEGLLEPAPNRPPRVVVSLPASPESDLPGNMRDVLWPILQESRILRVPESSIREMVNELVDGFFNVYTPPRVLVTECNTLDLHRYANELSAALDCDVYPVLLDDIADGLRDVDVVVAPHFHVTDARRALGSSDHVVVGLLLMPDATDISRLVSRTADGPLGVIARNPASLDRLTSVLRFYLDLPIISATLDNPDGIRKVVEEAEQIACTVQCQGVLRDAGAREKTIPVHYHVDHVSIEVLRQRLLEIQSLRTTAVDTDGAAGLASASVNLTGGGSST